MEYTFRTYRLLLLVFKTVESLQCILNNTHREKLCFTQFSIRNGWLTAFVYSHNQLSFIHSIITYQEYRSLKNVIHPIVSKNEWLLLSVSFTAKLGLVFVLAMEKAFSQRFYFKANRKRTNRTSLSTCKKRYKGFSK